MKKGYFLLEAIIATMILGVVLTSLMASMSAGNQNIQSAKFQTRALAVSEEVIENIRYFWMQNPAIGFPHWSLPPLNAAPFDTGWVGLGFLTTRDASFDSLVATASYRVSYRIRRADVDPRGPINPIVSTSLFFVDLLVADKGEQSLGATFTIILGRRGP